MLCGSQRTGLTDFNHANGGSAGTASIGAGGYELGFSVSLAAFNENWGFEPGLGPSFSFSTNLPERFGMGSMDTNLANVSSLSQLSGSFAPWAVFFDPALEDLVGDITAVSGSEYSFGGGYSYAVENQVIQLLLDTLFPPDIPPEYYLIYWGTNEAFVRGLIDAGITPEML